MKNRGECYIKTNQTVIAYIVLTAIADAVFGAPGVTLRSPDTGGGGVLRPAAVFPLGNADKRIESAMLPAVKTEKDCERTATGQLNRSLDGLVTTATLFADDAWRIYSSPARIDRRSALKIAGVLATFGALYAFDQDIHDAFQRNRGNAVYDKVIGVGEYFEPLGLAKTNHPFYLSAFAAGYVLRWPKLQEMSIQIIESMLIEGTMRFRLIAPAIGRARPYDDRGPRFFKFGFNKSLPSGHASNIFQLATIISHHVDFPLFTVAAYGIASTVALQRVHADAHWPSDVFLGVVSGIAHARAIIALHERRKLAVKPRLSIRQETLCLGFTWSF